MAAKLSSLYYLTQTPFYLHSISDAGKWIKNEGCMSENYDIDTEQRLIYRFNIDFGQIDCKITRELDSGTNRGVCRLHFERFNHKLLMGRLL